MTAIDPTRHETPTTALGAARRGLRETLQKACTALQSVVSARRIDPARELDRIARREAARSAVDRLLR
ncbi:hypothetical protein [Cognatishimia sp. F0-27]|uniref:hypothetical protein n=1 Tax=Cognatishimia sp. F0-27 TaxID=2816855 RepID=UPI001D0CB405|nr:hypothetical protein [Cognatishimia sp. F0-27]MCC1494614.1 hypothetical protein [Cognatishimia sp. F0-27]